MSNREPGFVGRHWQELAAAGAVVIAAGIAATALGLREDGAPERVAPSITPQTSIYDNVPVASEVAESHAQLGQLFHELYDLYGYAAASVPPTPSLRENLESFFYTAGKDGDSEPLPSLTEVLVLHDKRISAEDERALEVYSTTSGPLDDQFLRFVVRGTQVVLDRHSDDQIVMGGHTTAKITPRDLPHFMVLEDPSPTAVSGDSGRGRAVVYIKDGQAVSFVRGDRDDEFQLDRASTLNVDGISHDKFSMAGAICSARIKVEDTRAVFGSESAQRVAQETFPGFDLGPEENAKKDRVQVAAQENFCTGLGTLLTAIYYHGAEGAQLLLDNPRTSPAGYPLVNLGPFIKDLGPLLKLRTGIKEDPQTLNTIKGSSTPTVKDYLRQEAEATR